LNNASNSQSRVAIIGAGQLGFLLCESARELGLATVVVTPDATAPAIAIADHAIVTDLASPGLAAQIAELADVVTFEFEAVPDALLVALDALQAEGHLQVNPEPKVLQLLKNKARQKAWLVEHGFPTAAYRELSAAEAQDSSVVAKLALPFVQKAQEGGYDGYGVQIIKHAAELGQFWPVPSIVETFLTGARELAVVTARLRDGDAIAYPPVELVVDQERNILDVVIAPADLPDGVAEAATELGRAVINALGGAGVFAVEMFLLDGGELLVNEISPRVHNSGHHTLESSAASQFEQHMRAVAGIPLEPATQHSAAVMQNILYDDTLAPLLGLGPGVIPVQNDAVRVHWYGKHEGRPGRKMGHVTCLASNPVTARKTIKEALAGLTPPQGD
jgi:5-(carboxyamino)imidazole ribonucleotide synthase